MLPPAPTTGQVDVTAAASGRLLRDTCQKLVTQAGDIHDQCDALPGAMAALSIEDFAEDLARIADSANLLCDRVASLPNHVDGLDEEQTRKLRHDLRTPINAIKGYGEMICEDLDEEDLGEGDAAPVLHALHRLIGDAVAFLGHINDALPLNAGPCEPEDTGDAPAGTPPFGINVLRPHESPRDGRILVIDDNATNRHLLRKRLEREGHHIDEAADGERALAMIGETDYDLLLLDVMMPGISGYEVLHHVKSDERTHLIPVVMISSLEDETSVARCIEAGAEDYLYKPFNPVILRSRVAACLERKRLSDQIRIETDRADRLLLNILPVNVIDRLNNGEKVVADLVEDATVFFADIVDFTRFATNLSPCDIVGNLNVIFSTFDRLADKHGVEKIKIIGDAYMATCGVSEHRTNHTAAVADFALDIIDHMAQINRSLKQNLQIRIGIHRGPVTAGVIGTQKFAFDIWGSTVNFASRCEAYSIPDRINVSGDVARRLRDDFVFESRGTINMRGIGDVENFFLVGRR